MKQFFLLFTAILLGFDIWAQSNLLNKDYQTFGIDNDAERGSLICAPSSQQNFNSDSILLSRDLFTYDTKGNLVRTINQAYSSNNWGNETLDSTVYDANGRPITEYYFFWIQIWNKDTKIIKKYNTNGKPTEKVTQSWNGSVWTVDYRVLYTYDSNGNLTIEEGQEWVSNAWEKYKKTTTTYNAAKLPTYVLYQIWYTSTSAWTDDLAFTNTYNASNYMIEQVRENYDGVALAKEQHELFTYDISGKLTEIILEKWQNAAWAKNFKTTLIYSNDGLVERLKQYWDVSVWINNQRTSYTYCFPQCVKSEVNYWWSNNAWKLDKAYQYTCGQIVSSVNFIKEDALTMYPIPTNGWVNITLPNINEALVEIFTITGEKVMTQTTQGKNINLDVQALSEGVYFVQVQQREKSIRGKLLKQ